MFVRCDTTELLRQVGRMNVLAISGGRAERRRTGITLPVSNGYSVTIDLTAGDVYEVRRVFRRGGREWVKGAMRRVHCEEVGEVAYRASCFRDGEWGEAVTADV